MIGRRPHGRGQSLVETALVLPIFILLLVVLFDLGRAVFTLSTVGEAARQGARVAAVNQILTASECDQKRPIENPANAHWAPAACAVAAGSAVGVKPADVQIQYSVPAGTSLTCTNDSPPQLKVGCIVTVTVAATWSPITPLIGNLVGPMTLTGTSQMPIERVFP